MDRSLAANGKTHQGGHVAGSSSGHSGVTIKREPGYDSQIEYVARLENKIINMRSKLLKAEEKIDLLEKELHEETSHNAVQKSTIKSLKGTLEQIEKSSNGAKSYANKTNNAAQAKITKLEQELWKKSREAVDWKSRCQRAVIELAIEKNEDPDKAVAALPGGKASLKPAKKSPEVPSFKRKWAELDHNDAKNLQPIKKACPKGTFSPTNDKMAELEIGSRGDKVAKLNHAHGGMRASLREDEDDDEPLVSRWQRAKQEPTS